MVANVVDTMYFLRTEASVVRDTTKIASSCSSPVAPPALRVVPSDQCDGNQCCPGFD